MTTLDLQEFADKSPGTNGFFSGLGRVFASVRRWHLRRRTLARLSRLDAHVLRDIGFDPDLEPADVYDALEGQDASLWEKPHSRPDIR